MPKANGDPAQGEPGFPHSLRFLEDREDRRRRLNGQWEYLVIDTWGDLQEVLNKAGDLGWELVAIPSTPPIANCLVLKRKIL